ncbi:MAG TPA: class I SAM-dependent methyltransferase [Candidatus Manganitrophaceae bacterium]|nr:class I SAM-dependent methyltransferase [Candidatus Manganitrophaceae bacterium]
MSEPSSQSVAKVYNEWGKGFDHLVSETPFLMNSYLLYDRLLGELTRGKRFSRVLDVGCGSGLQSVALAPFADEVIGIDLSQELIEVAKERCKDHKNVRFEVANACRLPFPDRSFDFIISYGDVLSHIVDRYEEAVSEMGRVAKPGATLTLETDTKWNFGVFYHPFEIIDALRVRGKGHATRIWEGMRFKTFTYRELKSLLEKNGFEVLSVRGHNILASLIPDPYLLEKGKRTPVGRLALRLGKVDLALSGLPLFRRFGFNFVVTARKK